MEINKLNRKTKYQYGLLISSSMGMFIWGIIAAIAPLTTSWPFVKTLPKVYESIFLFLPTFFMMVGTLLFGSLADYIGRKKIYLTTIFLYAAGFITIFFANNVYILVLGIAMSEMGVGGEEVATLSLLSEDIPIEERGKYLVLVPNWNNVGSTVIAFIFLYFYSSSISIQKLYFVGIALFAISIAIFTRYRVPESFRWLRDTGKHNKAIEEMKKVSLTPELKKIRAPKFLPTLVFLGILGISQYLTFGLMAYIIGPYYFQNNSSLIIFMASLGASVAGLMAMYAINISRKIFAVFSYFGGFITTVLIFYFLNIFQNFYVFLIMLFINMMFSEFAWATRTTLEPELFPTKKRSTAIALIRIFPMVSYIISVFFTSSLDLQSFILYNIVLWGIGAFLTLIWYFYGIETKDISMDFIT